VVEDGVVREFDGNLQVRERALRWIAQRDAATGEVGELLAPDV